MGKTIVTFQNVKQIKFDQISFLTFMKFFQVREICILTRMTTSIHELEKKKLVKDIFNM